jgi:hypothetical protein
MKAETHEAILAYMADLEGRGIKLGRYAMFNDDSKPNCIAGHASIDKLYGQPFTRTLEVSVAGQALMASFELSEAEAEGLVEANDDASYETPELGIRAWLGGMS